MFVYLLVSSITLIIYFYSVRNHNYWRQRNVKYMKPLPFFGDEIYQCINKLTLSEMTTKLYKLFPNERVIGYFNGGHPELLITDPSLFKHILLTDYEHFSDKIAEVDLLDSASIKPVPGGIWRILRQNLISAFSVNKVRKIYPLIVKCSKRLQIFGDKIISKGGIIDGFEMMSRFVLELLCVSGLGIDLNIIADEQPLFYSYVINSVRRSKWQNTLTVLEEAVTLPKFLSIPYFLDDKIKHLLYDMILKVCKNRNFQPSDRNDFIDFLLESGAKYKTNRELIEKTDISGSSAGLELNLADPKLIVVQVLIFFIAGFETSVTSTSFTLHQLAYHPDIQRKIQDEIDEVLLRHNNELSYDAVAEMTLLEMAFQESIRIFPPIGIIRRVCTKKYTFPGTNVTVNPGIQVVIPIAAVHTDSKYYPDPYEFKPERFKSEVAKERNKYIYIPFGQGKRMCIGKQLGYVQSLTGLAAILQRFTVEPAPQSRREIKLNRACRIIQGIEGGIPIKLVPRNCNMQQ